MEDINIKEFRELKGQVDKIYHALMGDEMMNDGGMISLVKKHSVNIKDIWESVHANNKKFEDKLQVEINKNIKIDIYQKVIYSGLGGLFILIGTFIYQIITMP